MKRVLLCMLAVILFTPSAFGNATADWLKIIEDKHTTPKQVITLIKKGANVNAMKKGTGRESGIDWPVLQVAVMWNENPEVIQVLLKAGAYVDAKSTFFGDTALMLANNPEVVKALINAGADVNARSNSGETALMRTNNPEVIKILLNAGADVNVVNNDNTMTALWAASENTNPEVTKLLLNVGADVDAKNYFGDTALMWAVQYNTNPEVIKLLLNAGADINIRNREGKDAITLAQTNTNPEIRNMFKILEFGGIKSALINAAQKNSSPSDFRNLIDAGADIHAINQNGATVIMTAAANTSYPEVITILANAGADVNAKSNDGQTALMYAARFNPKPQILRVLINAGADINAKDSVFLGKTARDWAIQAGASQEVIKILEGL